jgi:hypothetical protein
MHDVTSFEYSAALPSSVGWGDPDPTVLLILGTGPLLAIVLAAELGLLSDPNPNPIGPGLLAFFTFWPAVIMIALGLIASLARYRTAMRQYP